LLTHHTLRYFPTRRSSDLLFHCSKNFRMTGKRSGMFPEVWPIKCGTSFAKLAMFSSTNTEQKTMRKMITGKRIFSRKKHFWRNRSEEHTSELQSRENLVCR